MHYISALEKSRKVGGRPRSSRMNCGESGVLGANRAGGRPSCAASHTVRVSFCSHDHCAKVQITDSLLCAVVGFDGNCALIEVRDYVKPRLHSGAQT